MAQHIADDESRRDGEQGPVIRDRRKLDPTTGKPRAAKESDSASGQTARQEAAAASAAANPAAGAAAPGAPSDPATAETSQASSGDSSDHPEVVAAQAKAAEHLEDLQRLHAEYVNYRKRVERDRDVARDQATAVVLEALLPVLDEVQLAREHGDLQDGPFAAIVEKLENVVGRFGLERFGEYGEVFDPTIHEALVHSADAQLPEGATTTTIVMVMQPGYRVGERLIRPARVAVADPPEEVSTGS